jgi:hypothetical protein
MVVISIPSNGIPMSLGQGSCNMYLRNIGTKIGQSDIIVPFVNLKRDIRDMKPKKNKLKQTLA